MMEEREYKVEVGHARREQRGRVGGFYVFGTLSLVFA